jgi:hypothetical protein
MQRFDTSDACRLKLDSVLRRYTMFRNDSHNDMRSRKEFNDSLLVGLQMVNGGERCSTFDLGLNQAMVDEYAPSETDHTGELFRGVAHAISKGCVSDFHYISHGAARNHWETHGKYVCSWRTAQYKLVAFTRIRAHACMCLRWYLKIVDTSQAQDDDVDSDAGTDGDAPLVLDSLFSALSQMHCRLVALEEL